MENRFKESRKQAISENDPIKDIREEEEMDTQPKLSFFATLFSSEFMPQEKAMALLPYFLFLAFLGVIYIGNHNRSEAKIRLWTEGQKEVKELRWEYIGLQSKWMMATKQSQISSSVAPLGLKESTFPPYIIQIEK